jgi:hypothetical protein
MSDAEELMSINVIETEISFGLMNGSIIVSLILSFLFNESKFYEL